VKHPRALGLPLITAPIVRGRLENVTFNHGVEGSSPSALTNQNNYLDRKFGEHVSQFSLWEACGKRRLAAEDAVKFGDNAIAIPLPRHGS